METEQLQKRPRDLLGLEDNSENDDSAAEEREEGRPQFRHPKRQRRDYESDDSDDDDDDDDDEDKATDSRFAGKPQAAALAETDASRTADPLSADAASQAAAESTTATITNPSMLKPLTLTELAASKAAMARTGVVYLSRIPPFMKPQKVRDLLSRFGAIGRVFLAPEDPRAHSKRVKFGGNKKRNFVEGWIEFASKKDARLCAETLNTQTVGGKKGSYYYDDVWNIKYLPKFKWHHLQAQIAYENASRQAKLRQEIAHETRVNKTYLRNVERAKMVENMQETRRQKRKLAEGGDDDGKPLVAAEEVEVRRQFRQHKVKGNAADKASGQGKSDKVKNLLSSVF